LADASLFLQSGAKFNTVLARRREAPGRAYSMISQGYDIVWLFEDRVQSVKIALKDPREASGTMS
jgi:hypothetical protein